MTFYLSLGRALHQFLRSSQDRLRLARQILMGIVLSVVFLALTLWLSEDVLHRETIHFDDPILYWMLEQRTPARTDAMRIISLFGSELTILIAIYAIVTLALKQHRRDAILFLWILLAGVGLNLLLKSTFDRPRPDLGALVTESSYSFPSGHAMNATVTYTAFAFFVFRRLENDRMRALLFVGSALLIGLIGLSRVYLGVHYPSDVVAGSAIGMLWFLLTITTVRSVRFVRLFRRYRRAKR